MKRVGTVYTNVTSTSSKFLFIFFSFSESYFPSSKKRQQEPSSAHFRQLREVILKATPSSQVFMMVLFRKGIILQLVQPFQRNESVVSENLNDDPAVSRDQENNSSLLSWSINYEWRACDLEQIHQDVEELQFSENTVMGNRSSNSYKERW